jgi:CxxC motif-containing protein
MTRELTCINCPMGCHLVATLDDRTGEVTAVQGNTCARGAAYARSECTHPTRMVTAAIFMGKGELPLSVRTDRPIPKDRIFDCLKAIYAVRPQRPVALGQVILPNVLGTGADIIATRAL